MRDLYDTTRKLAGKFQQTSSQVKDKEGNILTREDEQLKRWAQYFNDLLNRPPPPELPIIPEASAELNVNCGKPSKLEIVRSIKMLKSGKAAGPDNIPPESLKADPDLSADILYGLLGKIWEEEEMPQDWNESYIVKLPKKGDRRECKNYRGISLMSTAGKVLNRIILLRLQGAVDATLRDQQAGFRKDHSCIDQIATLRIIIEQSIEWNTSLYVNFIDFEKAFDSLDRSVLWCLMRHYGIPGKFIRIIKNSYDKMTCRVLHASGLSDSFAVNTGVKQGCLMAPFLFLLAMDWIMKETTREQRNGIQWNLLEQLEDLEFADDIALVSSNNQQMQDKTARLTANSIKLGLHPNVSKTKVMKVNCTNNRPVKVRDTILEEVTSFVYLGSVVSIDGGSDEDIKVRINKARVAFNMLRKVWSSHVISRRTKFRIFNTNVKAVLLYGSETWRTTNQTSQKLQTFVNKCLRRILKISWTDRVTNEMLWELAGEEPIITQISKRKWRWIGHILRKPANNITRQALRWNPQGKRKRGRPRNSWRRGIDLTGIRVMLIKNLNKSMSGPLAHSAECGADNAKVLLKANKSVQGWVEEDESSLAYFFRLEKRRSADSLISALRDPDGSIVSSPSALCASLRSFYSCIFTASPTDPLVQSSLLRNLTATLPRDQASHCEGSLTPSGVLKALKGMARGKAPGLDGLPMEFYLKFWDVIGPDLVTVLNSCFFSGCLSLSQRRGVITLAFKKGNRLDPRNWKPISLLNVDYKLASRTIAGCLLDVIHLGVKRDQTCGVPGRYIGENVALLRDVVTYAESSATPIAVLSLDQEKAFDRVDWGFMRSTLLAMGFGPSFISWVDLFYNRVQSTVNVNGYLTFFFNLSRGVRKGCPLSPLLYVLVSEVLACNIRAYPRICGLNLPGCPPVSPISQYADDTSLILTSDDAIRAALEIYTLFEKASGSKLNIAKSKGLWLGGWRGRSDPPVPFDWSASSLKILDIFIGPGKLDEENWRPRINAMAAQTKSKKKVYNPIPPTGLEARNLQLRSIHRQL
ncbi:Transposon TX1 uncharacterized 149 kDa protein [Stylophora pistillata]|uniref:Transposon TX1 uncharacterized 149 kDa protein n=1 Tax=Stylophora pistillata TaxID=50429 RepID=A0A2B4SLP8_STYPI|nr:Transposon TX1 uncharacterized 149 kDa protein [Stylophora pistillata]